MDDRFNTIAGWALFSGIVALGMSSVSSKYFQADKDHPPHKTGYAIEGVASEGGDAEVPIATLLATADPAKGEQVFKKCTSCHTINSGGANGIGPNLYGIVGEGVGTGHPGFAFSEALKSHGGSWDFDTLDAWLHNPKKFAPGTKMTFAGLGKAEDRANLMVYMNAQGSNKPLPPPPAADAAPAAGDAAAPADGAAAPASADAAAKDAAPAAAAKEATPPAR